MRALVRVSVCPLNLHPRLQSERADEALCGAAVDVLELTRTGWALVKTHDSYRGYAPEAALLFGDDSAAQWAVLPKRLVLGAFCDVLSAPAVQGWPVETLVRGALVAPQGAPDSRGWQKLSLCDGREGYARRSLLGAYASRPTCTDEPALRRAIAASALAYLGVPYRWGGKSPLGIDCSGLTAMAYALNGVTIFRDARMAEGFPVKDINRGRMQCADLLFFPGHVALLLGDGSYVHSTAQDGSDGVVINSLNPAAPNYRADLAQSLTAVGSIF